jgi:hypothetical protein
MFPFGSIAAGFPAIILAIAYLAYAGASLIKVPEKKEVFRQPGQTEEKVIIISGSFEEPSIPYVSIVDIHAVEEFTENSGPPFEPAIQKVLLPDIPVYGYQYLPYCFSRPPPVCLY